MENKIQITSTPHDRPDNQTIKPAPQTEEEFYQIVNNAPWQELKEYGFRKWDTMNSIIRENIEMKDRPSIISIPVYNTTTPQDAANKVMDAVNGNANPDGSMLYDLGSRDQHPTKLLEQDEDLILFTGEWYDLIPDGFKCTSLWGEEVVFEKGKSGKDTRYGCIPYGIRRPLS
jgi:hypothetical protein